MGLISYLLLLYRDVKTRGPHGQESIMWVRISHIYLFIIISYLHLLLFLARVSDCCLSLSEKLLSVFFILGLDYNENCRMTTKCLPKRPITSLYNKRRYDIILIWLFSRNLIKYWPWTKVKLCWVIEQ
jgi:hypothetical protein